MVPLARSVLAGGDGFEMVRVDASTVWAFRSTWAGFVLGVA